MATTSAALPSFFSSDADFRAWVQGVHDALTACGMTQTSDTGQINPATVAKPASGGSATVAGYEIWRFNDTLQSTLPIFFKIEYGAAASGNAPNVWITVGTGSNGSGALNGQVGSRQALTAGSDTAGATRPTLCQGDGGQIHLATDVSPTGAAGAMGVSIERGRLADGTPTADGFVAVYYFQNSMSVQHFPPTGGVPGAASSAFYVNPGAGRAVYGNDTVMSPLFVMVGKVMFTYMSVMDPTTMSADVIFTADLLGATRTFRSIAMGAVMVIIPWS